MSFDYLALNPGDSIVFDQAVPVRNGIVGIVTHVAETGIDAFVLSRTGPFYAEALTHESDPRLTEKNDLSLRLIQRGVFKVPPASSQMVEFRQDRDEIMREISAMKLRLQIMENLTRRLRKMANANTPETVEEPVES